MVTQETQVHIVGAFYRFNRIWALEDNGRYHCSHWPKDKWINLPDKFEELNWDSPTILCKGLDQW